MNSGVMGFSLSDFSFAERAWALGDWASVVAARGLSSCGAQAYWLCGMWNPPGPGIKPVSSALAGSFPRTVPPGKSDPYFTDEKTEA